MAEADYVTMINVNSLIINKGKLAYTDN